MANTKIKTYTIVALASALVVSLSGFDPIHRAYNDQFRNGTLAGIVECVRLSSSDLLSEGALKSACANSFEIALAANDLGGLGGPREVDGRVSLGASLENKHSDRVFTWLELELIQIDSDGQKKTYSTNSRMWIEPSATGEYLERIKELKTEELDGFKFCEDPENDKDCWTWGIVDARGVKIN